MSISESCSNVLVTLCVGVGVGVGSWVEEGGWGKVTDTVYKPQLLKTTIESRIETTSVCPTANLNQLNTRFATCSSIYMSSSVSYSDVSFTLCVGGGVGEESWAGRGGGGTERGASHRRCL